MIAKSAAELVVEARRRAGLTQAELAARAGVTQSVISAYEKGRRQPTMPMLLALLRASGYHLDASLVPIRDEAPTPFSGPVGRRLEAKRLLVQRVADEYGVEVKGVFGSVARGRDGANSDVDLLVDLPEGMGLFKLGKLRGELEALLGGPVDLVPLNGLKPDVRDRVLDELVTL